MCDSHFLLAFPFLANGLRKRRKRPCVRIGVSAQANRKYDLDDRHSLRRMHIVHRSNRPSNFGDKYDRPYCHRAMLPQAQVPVRYRDRADRTLAAAPTTSTSSGPPMGLELRCLDSLSSNTNLEKLALPRNKTRNP